MKKLLIILMVIILGSVLSLCKYEYDITVEFTYCNEDSDCGTGFVCIDGFCIEVVEE
jgi:Cys-rich repeat protein